MLKSITDKISKPVFDAKTPEEAIARFVDEVKKFPGNRNFLVDLLPEQNPLYAGRGTNRTARLRGYILAAFGQVGLPDKALTYVLDELENGDDAYLVAAAAIALRGSKEPSPNFIPYLIKAIRNIRYDDDSLTFDCYKPPRPLPNSTTALKEIFRTFAWMRVYAKEILPDLENLSNDREYNFSAPVRAEIEKAIVNIRNDKRLINTDCCSIPANFRVLRHNAKSKVEKQKLFERIEFEDQEGNNLKYRDFFNKKPAVVVFFYTRCDNLNKCSLTVTKLALLQKVLEEHGIGNEIKTAAITYDSGYDLPPRLKAYGQNRGISFGEQNKIFRATCGSQELHNYFQLGVNFAGSTVNRHRIELYILDSDGSIAVAFERLQWEISEVIEQTKLLLEKNNSRTSHQRKHNFSCRIFNLGRTIYDGAVSTVVPLIVVFFPKCPICWAGYLSLFGITGLQTVPYSPWLLPIFVALIVVNLFSIFKRAKRNRRFEAFGLTFLGVLTILVFGIHFGVPYISFLGMTMIFVGSLMSSLSNKKTARISYRLEQNRT